MDGFSIYIRRRKGGSRGMAQDIGLSVDRVASAVGILAPAVQRHF